jgi:hypothetical protein
MTPATAWRRRMRPRLAAVTLLCAAAVSAWRGISGFPFPYPRGYPESALRRNCKILQEASSPSPVVVSSGWLKFADCAGSSQQHAIARSYPRHGLTNSTRSVHRPPRIAPFALRRLARTRHQEKYWADRLLPNDVAPRQRSPTPILHRTHLRRSPEWRGQPPPNLIEHETNGFVRAMSEGGTTRYTANRQR